MELARLVIVSAIVLGVSVLAMAVGILFRNKTFTSCGCASITFRGEKLRCPACPEPAEGACPEKEEDDKVGRNS